MRKESPLGWPGTLALSAVMAMASGALAAAPAQTAASEAGTSQGGGYTPGVPFTAEQINALLPQTVYFQGRTAPLQLRNAAGMAFSGGQIVWVSLVDSSGYATSVQERYQFYLVTEGPLRVGDAVLPAGAYGGGFVGDQFLLMDLGGHTLAQGPTQTDPALQRPRPLQLRAAGPAEATLYLGRRSVRLRTTSKVPAP